MTVISRRSSVAEPVPATEDGVDPHLPEARRSGEPEPSARRLRSSLGRRAGGGRSPLPTRSAWYLPAATLGILSVLLLGFCLQLVLLSNISYSRSQQIALSKFRYELARATAPVGQTFTPEVEVQERAIAGEKEKAVAPPVPLLHPLGTPVAVLSIPAVGMVNTVILEGTTPGVMQRGPGHERNSVLPGQEGWSLLYGRAWSYGGPFGDIATLSRGDRISVTTGQGKNTYSVTGVRRPGDPLPQRKAGEGRLVLGTAEGSAFVPENVVYVDAILTSKVQPTPPRQVLTLSPSEKIMAGDASVWFSVLLWVQGLAVAILALTWARARWGRAQSWIVGVPVLTALSIGAADTVVRLLPNVL